MNAKTQKQNNNCTSWHQCSCRNEVWLILKNNDKLWVLLPCYISACRWRWIIECITCIETKKEFKELMERRRWEWGFLMIRWNISALSTSRPNCRDFTALLAGSAATVLVVFKRAVKDCFLLWHISLIPLWFIWRVDVAVSCILLVMCHFQLDEKSLKNQLLTQEIEVWVLTFF